ncbi:MAG: anion permease [Candidatus Yanofskybacteria bacterium CG10_big_fil_rev_8_21_14_0_10_36_16]|uniref:Anion permease n=1 Tax=Candidatus Yanofskybacteria bacterium CG10_big_fil_rev_8_21_14_0_10_36_16 TaxID=1975096 RepID=A0A2J0Q743_9BACT|nr:MAG: anion permease [Candidatus Yanofskybacteria bacterium CG10_big_fil_rev_8_21_14_0_10_36_16]
MSELLLIIFIVAIAWIYDFYNGANDAANAIATTVSTRTLSPTKALLLSASLNTAGAFVTTRVAKTIGKGIVDPQLLTGDILISALLGAIVWVALSTKTGMPVSVTHAIVGGIIGAVFLPYGLGAIKTEGITKIIKGIIFSPILGFIVAGILLVMIHRIRWKSHPGKIQRNFGKAQIISASWMSLAHGMNDTQNAMGIITAALFAGGFISKFEVPMWVIIGSGLFMGIGTYAGGKHVIKTVGMKLSKLKPVHGFVSETAAGGVIAGASYLGIPISTTHAITSSIMGASTAQRVKSVRWNIAKDIAMAWILTIPGSAIAALIIYTLINLI